MKSPKKTARRIAAAGHAAHTQDAGLGGLAGGCDRSIKITLLGAGSAFTPRLLNDILLIPGHQGGVLALVDIDLKRLSTMRRLVVRLLTQLGQAGRWKVLASADRNQVLAGSNYIINCIEVSGLECVRFDNAIPRKYGIDQCIGDTIGPGGLFKALRTIPVFLALLRDCERLCPQALVLNYTNPMAMMCTAAGRASSMAVVGLCHSVQGTSRQLANYAGIPYAELDWECAGINHLAWFTRLEHRGVDLYRDRLYHKFRSDLTAAEAERRAGLTAHDDKNPTPPAYREGDLVRKDMCLHFGAFITESSGHLSEYLPYYRKSDAGRALLRQAYDGGSGFYVANWPEWRKDADDYRLRLLRGMDPLGWERSFEYASWIIEAREKDAPYRIHGNVMNHHGGAGQLITNLPADACVEVACLVDANGVHPTRYGALPRQMAHVCASNLGLFDLGAQAAIELSKEAAIHALLLDPLSAAVCTPSQIRDMALELFAAEQAFLPAYR